MQRRRRTGLAAAEWTAGHPEQEAETGGGRMLTITIRVQAPAWEAQGVKEALAVWLEQYGDARVVSVAADEPRQMEIEREKP